MAQQAQANALENLGKHLGAAQMRLASAEQLFASGDRTYACVNLFGVAADLHALGESETALILGTWLVRLTGATMDEERRTGVYSHIDDFLELLHQLSPEELARIEPQAAAMTDADALALARDRIHHQELLAGIGEGDASERPYKA